MRLAIYCAGGVGKEVYDLVRRNNDTYFSEIFFVDDSKQLSTYYGEKLLKFTDVSYDCDLKFVIATGEPYVREKLAQKVITAGFELINIVDKTAIISPSAKIGIGNIICSNVFVSSDVVLKNNILLQSNCNIGHDSIIEDNSVVSSFCQVSGHCKIGKTVYIGIGSQVKEGIKLGDYVILGMGSNLFTDIEDEMVAMGSPARSLKRNDSKRVFKSE